MSKKMGRILVGAVLSTLVFVAACESGQPAPVPQPVPQAVPMQMPPQVTPPPVPQVAVPVPPPATPLIPVSDTPAVEPETPKKGTSSGGSVDAPLPGKGTSGDELLGNYSCSIESKQLSIGPIKPPPFGCKITRSQSGELKMASSSEGAGSMKGTVTDPKEGGFFVSGKYEMSGNTLAIKSRMKLVSPGKYKGSGRGVFNDDKSNKIDYKLTMTRQ